MTPRLAQVQPHPMRERAVEHDAGLLTRGTQRADSRRVLLGPPGEWSTEGGRAHTYNARNLPILNTGTFPPTLMGPSTRLTRDAKHESARGPCLHRSAPLDCPDGLAGHMALDGPSRAGRLAATAERIAKSEPRDRSRPETEEIR
jgi:hypothetical protein